MKISKRLLAWALSLVITASAGIPAAASEAGLPGEICGIIPGTTAARHTDRNTGGMAGWI